MARSRRSDLPSPLWWDEQHARAEAEADFWDAHFDEYAAAYPDQWLAVEPMTEHLLAASLDLDTLLRQLDTLGREPTRVWITFAAHEPLPLVL